MFDLLSDRNADSVDRWLLLNSLGDLLTLTTDIVSAHVSNNNVAICDVPVLIANVYASLAGLGIAREPAVSVRRSVKPDYIICLEDRKKLKMLKRHLMRHYQMTPDHSIAPSGTCQRTGPWWRPTMPNGGVCWRRRSVLAASQARLRLKRRLLRHRQ